MAFAIFTGAQATAQEGSKKQIVVEMHVVEISQAQSAKLLKHPENSQADGATAAAAKCGGDTSFPFANIFGGGQLSFEVNSVDVADSLLADSSKSPATPNPTVGEADDALDYRSTIVQKGVITGEQLQSLEKQFSSVGCVITKSDTITLANSGAGRAGVTQKFTYDTEPAKRSEVTADMKATIEDDDQAIDLEIAPQWVCVVGAVAEKDGKTALVPVSNELPEKSGSTPVLDRAAGSPAKSAISIWEGQTVVFAGKIPVIETAAKSEKPKLSYKTVVMLLTARIVEKTEK